MTSLLLALVLSAPAGPPVLESVVGVDQRPILAEATRVEGFRLYPAKDTFAEDPRAHLGAYPIRFAAGDLPAGVLNGLKQMLLDPATYGAGQLSRRVEFADGTTGWRVKESLCGSYQPRHGLRFHAGRRSVDVFICFACDEIVVGDAQRAAIASAPARQLEKLLASPLPDPPTKPAPDFEWSEKQWSDEEVARLRKAAPALTSQLGDVARSLTGATFVESFEIDPDGRRDAGRIAGRPTHSWLRVLGGPEAAPVLGPLLDPASYREPAPSRHADGTFRQATHGLRFSGSAGTLEVVVSHGSSEVGFVGPARVEWHALTEDALMTLMYAAGATGRLFPTTPVSAAEAARIAAALPTETNGIAVFRLGRDDTLDHPRARVELDAATSSRVLAVLRSPDAWVACGSSCVHRLEPGFSRRVLRIGGRRTLDVAIALGSPPEAFLPGVGNLELAGPAADRLRSVLLASGTEPAFTRPVFEPLVAVAGIASPRSSAHGSAALGSIDGARAYRLRGTGEKGEEGLLAFQRRGDLLGALDERALDLLRTALLAPDDDQAGVLWHQPMGRPRGDGPRRTLSCGFLSSGAAGTAEVVVSTGSGELAFRERDGLRWFHLAPSAMDAVLRATGCDAGFETGPSDVIGW